VDSSLLGTTSAVVDTDRSRCCYSLSTTRTSSSARYGDTSPCWHHLIRSGTRSQSTSCIVGSRGRNCVTHRPHRPVMPQQLEPTEYFDEQEGKRAKDRRVPVRRWVTWWVTVRPIDRPTDWVMLRIWRRATRKPDTVRVICGRINRSESRWIARILKSWPIGRVDQWPHHHRVIWNPGFRRVELQPVGPHPWQPDMLTRWLGNHGAEPPTRAHCRWHHGYDTLRSTTYTKHHGRQIKQRQQCEVTVLKMWARRIRTAVSVEW